MASVGSSVAASEKKRLHTSLAEFVLAMREKGRDAKSGPLGAALVRSEPSPTPSRASSSIAWDR